MNDVIVWIIRIIIIIIIACFGVGVACVIISFLFFFVRLLLADILLACLFAFLGVGGGLSCLR